MEILWILLIITSVESGRVVSSIEFQNQLACENARRIVTAQLRDTLHLQAAACVPKFIAPPWVPRRPPQKPKELE